MDTQVVSLDELIDNEIETIIYTCAPEPVKDEARKRYKALREQRAAARAQLEPHPKGDRYCVLCGGFGWLTYAEGGKASCSCTAQQASR